MENPVKEKSETIEDLENLINEIFHNYNEKNYLTPRFFIFFLVLVL